MKIVVNILLLMNPNMVLSIRI